LQVLGGGLRHNALYAGVEIGPGREIVVGNVFGVMRVKPDEPKKREDED
jgi:hypothetical protein